MSDELQAPAKRGSKKGGAHVGGLTPHPQNARPEAESRPTRSGLPRVLLVLMGLAAAWLVISGMKELSSIIAPVLLALTLMIAAYPIKTFLVRRLKAPEWVGALAAGAAVIATLVAFFWAIGWALAKFVTEMPRYQDKFMDLYHQSLRLVSRFGVSEASVQESLQGFDPTSLFGVARAALGGVSSGVGVLTVVATVLIFMMMDAMGFGQRLDTVERYHPNLAAALDMFADGVRRYWVITTIFGLIVALLDLGVLLVMGVPLAMVWAVLSFLTNYIPNIGFVMGLVPPTLMALLTKGVVPAIIVAVLYAVLNFVVQSIIQPRFAGDAVGVTPTVSFLSLLFWGYVWGLLGALIALPATLLFKALLVDVDPESRWANAFLSNDVKKAEPKKERRDKKGWRPSFD